MEKKDLVEFAVQKLVGVKRTWGSEVGGGEAKVRIIEERGSTRHGSTRHLQSTRQLKISPSSTPARPIRQPWPYNDGHL